MGLSNIKSYFKLYDLAELTPEQRFKNSKNVPQYFWAGCESEANSRRTTPAPSRRTSEDVKRANKNKSDSQIAMELFK